MQVFPQDENKRRVTKPVTKKGDLSQSNGDCDIVTKVTDPASDKPYIPKSIEEIRGKSVSAWIFCQMDFPPPQWIVPGLLMDGNTLLAGGPKHGKTYFALNVAVEMSWGGQVAGNIPVKQQKVLYMTWRSEGPAGSFRDRVLKMAGDRGINREHFFIAYDWPTFGNGGEEAIMKHLEAEPDTKLIIIDTFKRIREPNSGRRSAYDEDYEAFQPIAEIADRSKVSFLVLHHTNKRLAAEDPFDLVSGSTGMTAAVDSVSIWKKRQQGATLYMRGRSVEENEVAFEFDDQMGGWKSLGSSEAFHRSSIRNEILQILAASEDPLTPLEVADLIEGSTPENVRQQMWRMAHAGEYVVKVARGKYGVDTFYKNKLIKNEEAPF